MRPVNLIPTEERAGHRRPMRGGPLAYIVVGALVAALVGVTALVTTDNAISDRKVEIMHLKAEVAATEARAAELSAYTAFHQVREQRMTTIASLANSRFDWERVMRELALVLPDDVWLTSLSAGSTAGTNTSGESSGLRTAVAGPALNLSGCASSQDAVAGFIQALKEIDGVTRVGMQGSSIGSNGTASSGSAAGGGCQTRDFIAQFQMVVAFDAAPVPPEGGEAPAAVAAAPEEGATTSEPTSSTAESEAG